MYAIVDFRKFTFSIPTNFKTVGFIGFEALVVFDDI